MPLVTIPTNHNFLSFVAKKAERNDSHPAFPLARNLFDLALRCRYHQVGVSYRNSRHQLSWKKELTHSELQKLIHRYDRKALRKLDKNSMSEMLQFVTNAYNLVLRSSAWEHIESFKKFDAFFFRYDADSLIVLFSDIIRNELDKDGCLWNEYRLTQLFSSVNSESEGN